jgi:hypothetical protein
VELVRSLADDILSPVMQQVARCGSGGPILTAPGIHEAIFAAVLIAAGFIALGSRPTLPARLACRAPIWSRGCTGSVRPLRRPRSAPPSGAGPDRRGGPGWPKPPDPAAACPGQTGAAA